MPIKYTLSKKPLIDKIEVRPVHNGQCHCGSVKFTVRLEKGLIDPRRCNCSICRRRGAVVASVELKDLTVDQGEDVLSLYQFNTHTAKHYFCSRCGIYTHHQRRSNPKLYAFNIACLDGIDPFVLKTVPVLDGEDHPRDRQEGA
ncbi:MAG: GFA family protein [Wenzhouxiangellaceae bacterium]